MFRIECLVRDTKLAEVLRTLDGKVANLDVRPVIIKDDEAEAAAAAKPNGKKPKAVTSRSRKPGEVSADVLAAVNTVPIGTIFRIKDVSNCMEPGAGPYGTVWTNMQRLVESGILVKEGSTYRRVR